MPFAFNPLVFAGLDKGGSGAPGPEGPKGAWTPKGEWKAATAYAVNDAVTWKGSTYGCIKAMTAGEDKEPPNATFWEALAEKGAAGATGEKGEKGTAGETGSPKTAKAPLEVSGTEIVLKPAGIIAEYLGAESVETSKIKLLAVTAATLAAEAVETAKIKDKAVTDAKLAGLSWVNVEAVNAKLEQTVTIQVAVFNGLVFMRGLGKAKEEMLAKAILFTLPAAARPATARNVVYDSNVGTTTANLNIKTNGEVETSTALAVGKTPSFDGIVFSL